MLVYLSGLTADLDLFITDDLNGTSCNALNCLSEGNPNLSDHLEGGLEALGIDVTDVEDNL